MYAPESSRIDVQVVHPGQGTFSIEVIASGFKGPGALILDNLVYEADLCEEAEPVASQPGQQALVESPMDGNVEGNAVANEAEEVSMCIKDLHILV